MVRAPRSSGWRVAGAERVLVSDEAVLEPSAVADHALNPVLARRSSAGNAAMPQKPQAASVDSRLGSLAGLSLAAWFALVGCAVLAGPTLYLIALASWTDEQSQQGPIVLAIGAWLLWRRWPQMREVGRAGSVALAVLGFMLCGAVYVSGRVASLFLLEAYSLYGFGICAIYALVGLKGLAKGLFPIVFLAFAAPIPFFVGFPVTVHLRLWISEATVGLLRLCGVGAARDGLTLFVESYRIEIAQACSGMNSLLALTALGLCYVHIRRDPPLGVYLMLFPVIVAFAIVANFVRVMMLALLTLSFGDAVAQGWLHETLGFVTFAVALGLTFLADAALAQVWRVRARAGAHLA